MTAVLMDREKVSTSKASRIGTALKKKNNLLAFLLSAQSARLFSFPSAPLLWPSSSSIKLSLSKPGELVTSVLNPSSHPLLNHPPCNPPSPSLHFFPLTPVLDGLHVFYPQVAQVQYPPLTSEMGDTSPGSCPDCQTLEDTHTHTQTAMCSFPLLCLAVFHTRTGTHTQFPGNHPHFPSIIRSHTIAMCDPTLLHFPPASR